MNDAPLVTVGVCTYRRPRLLEQTLLSLSRQVTRFPFEVVVVDNDHMRGAEPVVDRCRPRFAEQQRDLRYAVEEQQNISLARNKAITSARGEFIAFIDDDERAEEDWLEAICSCLVEMEADAVFGPAIKIIPADFPAWMKRGAVFDHGSLPDRTVMRPGIRVFFGATNNACFKRTLLTTRKEPFDPGYGRTGGEDSELFYFLQSRGAKLVWCARARVWEEVEENRKKWQWHLTRGYRTGWAYARIRHDHDGAVIEPVARSAVGTIAAIVRYVGQCHRGRLALLMLLRDLARQAGRIGYYSGLQFLAYKERPIATYEGP